MNVIPALVERSELFAFRRYERLSRFIMNRVRVLLNVNRRVPIVDVGITTYPQEVQSEALTVTYLPPTQQVRVERLFSSGVKVINSDYVLRSTMKPDLMEGIVLRVNGFAKT